jgi:hypothetical protein
MRFETALGIYAKCVHTSLIIRMTGSGRGSDKSDEKANTDNPQLAIKVSNRNVT